MSIQGVIYLGFGLCVVTVSFCIRFSIRSVVIIILVITVNVIQYHNILNLQGWRNLGESVGLVIFKLVSECSW